MSLIKNRANTQRKKNFVISRICSFLLVFLVSVFAWSQPPMSGTTHSRLLPQNRGTSSQAKFTKYQLESLIETQYYPASVSDKKDLNSSQYAEVYGDFYHRKNIFDFKIAAAFASYFRPNESYYAFYDLYSGVLIGDQLRINLGRKLMNWSTLDAHQNMGLWQSKFALDPLRQRQQGLTGISAEFESKYFVLRALYSPLHVPSIGSDLKVKNGNFVTSNRWSRPPSDRLNFLSPDNQNKIDYNLEVGDITKLINHQGQAYQARAQVPVGFFTQASWASKPINDILILREDYKPANGSNTANINLRPAIGYHEVRTLELGFETQGYSKPYPEHFFDGNKENDFRFVVSATQDAPRKTQPDRDRWVIQQPLKAEVYGALAELQLNTFSMSPTLGVSYTKINGGRFVDIKSNGQVDEFITFENRFLFYDYFSGWLEADVFHWKDQALRLRMAYLYDQQQKGSLISSQLSFLSKRRWGVHLGLDILGVENENTDKTFLNSFRANDRLYGGLNYVF